MISFILRCIAKHYTSYEFNCCYVNLRWKSISQYCCCTRVVAVPLCSLYAVFKVSFSLLIHMYLLRVFWFKVSIINSLIYFVFILLFNMNSAKINVVHKFTLSLESEHCLTNDTLTNCILHNWNDTYIFSPKILFFKLKVY